ncbi:MAG TPA: hypothetical protein VFK37_02085 [Bacillales bacterium]|nr:hypothetical protein [Bacillales bacterium]
MNGKPTIVFDFDGVIHSYTSGWKGVEVIPDPPVDGIREVIEKLRKKYRLLVVSSRCRDAKGRVAIKKWLLQNEIEVDGITNKKEPAIVYVDDRAVTFNGDAKKLYEQIKDFKPWHKR